MQQPIITRFAPSPTGYIHIGNLRSAIYPFLLARQTDGQFILRIEDTDQQRYVPGSTELILDTLRWLGLNWDQGPEIGGPHQPYYQSERREIYYQWAKKLIVAGRAYADPTPSEQIEQYRQSDQAAKVPYLYRNHRPTNTPKWEPGIPLRFKSEPKSYAWHDEVMGDLSTGPEVLDDIILIKADGLPTYNFAHIVDDAKMQITHVCRGVEYLSSMPNYLALYEALGLKQPKIVSMPHILAPTGNKKLGKRDGAKSATAYRKEGILPEAMLNYLACLGWNDGSEQEIYTLSELIQYFRADHIQNSGARFDEVKLHWMNGQWIRKLFQEEGIDQFFKRTIDFWPSSAQKHSPEYQKKVLNIIYDRLKILAELKDITGYFFEEPVAQPELILHNKFLKKIPGPELISLLDQATFKLSSLKSWQPTQIQDCLNQLLQDTGKKPAELFSLIRIAISFAPFSPALHLTLDVLGQETTLNRLKKASQSLKNS